MDIRIIPTCDLSKSHNEPYINLMIQSEKEIGEGILDIEVSKRGIRELGFKFLSEQSIKLHNVHCYAIFFKNELIGKYSIKSETIENKTVALLDYIYIKKKYRHKGISSDLIKKMAIEHDFFGIENPLRNTLNFWTKVIIKMYAEKITTSAYIIFPSDKKTNGYLCVGGDCVIVAEMRQYPAVILKHKFTPDELKKVVNTNIIPIPQQIKDVFIKKFLKKP